MQIGLESERASVVTPKPYTWIHFSEYATTQAGGQRGRDFLQRAF